MPSTRTSNQRITTAITAKLTAGALPWTVVRTWGGPSSGRPCDGCDAPIDRRDLEIEMELGEGQARVLHVDCFLEWFDLTRKTRERQSS